MRTTLLHSAKALRWRRIAHLVQTHQPVGWATVVEAAHQRRHHPLPYTDRSVLTELLADLRAVTTDLPLVRLGPLGDGGYLVPDDLDGVVACFSPGVDTVSGFEADCAARGIDVFMADATVDGPAVDHPRFRFAKQHVGVCSDDRTLTFDEWAADTLGDRPGDLILQMDIEGGEWPVLLNVSDRLLERFRVIVIELHDLDLLHLRPTFELMAPAIRRLLHSHVCVHIHPNNSGGAVELQGIDLPKVIEFTFLRRDRAEATGLVTSYPHPLDVDNSHWPSLEVPACLRP